MFAERCKKAGEFIHRTVDNVEGIFLLKLRPNTINFGHSQERQFALDDPYGRDLGGVGYIQTFLAGSHREAASKGLPVAGAPPPLKGYRYVDAIDVADGQRYRYTGSVQEYESVASPLVGGNGEKFKRTEFVVSKVPGSSATPRYGVTYDDISTRGEREHWIAGSSLKVIDLQTREVIAERVGYMMDRGQGNISGGRSPWLEAAEHSCPPIASRPRLLSGPAFAAQTYKTASFVERVLKPSTSQGEYLLSPIQRIGSEAARER
ncbi:hypothetical protein [uncultured Methylibium sp.]|uniref:hypothetical protein n=1 Tax=uncultured Methylibium sp. TaxID=381093 RepID=UPI0025E5A74A|nr:hypothetical protein [uncultured Methylibium sp.]